MRRRNRIVFGAGITLLLLVLAYSAYVRIAFGTVDPLGVPNRVQYHDRCYYYERSGPSAIEALEQDGLALSDLVVVDTGPPPVRALLVEPADVDRKAPVAIYVRTVFGETYELVISGDPE